MKVTEHEGIAPFLISETWSMIGRSMHGDTVPNMSNYAKLLIDPM